MVIGRISEEVEIELNMPRSTPSTRCFELRMAGYINYLYNEHGKRETRDTTTKSPAFVLVATQRGADAIKHNLPLQLRDDHDATRRKHRGIETSEMAFERTNREGDARRVLACIVKYTPSPVLDEPPETAPRVHGAAYTTKLFQENQSLRQENQNLRLENQKLRQVLGEVYARWKSERWQPGSPYARKDDQNGGEEAPH